MKLISNSRILHIIFHQRKKNKLYLYFVKTKILLSILSEYFFAFKKLHSHLYFFLIFIYKIEKLASHIFSPNYICISSIADHVICRSFKIFRSIWKIQRLRKRLSSDRNSWIYEIYFPFVLIFLFKNSQHSYPI